LAGGDGLAIVVRKASGQGWFRCHPELHSNIWMLEVKIGPDAGFYLIAPVVQQLLRREENEDVKVFPARLTLCYSRDSGLFLWPLRLPEEGKQNRQDDWSLAALRTCAKAEVSWMKLFVRKGANTYSDKPAPGITDEPPWPDISMDEAAGLAFEGKYITDANDPLIRRLLGLE
jgi:hypothetical protein